MILKPISNEKHDIEMNFERKAWFLFNFEARGEAAEGVCGLADEEIFESLNRFLVLRFEFLFCKKIEINYVEILKKWMKWTRFSRFWTNIFEILANDTKIQKMWFWLNSTKIFVWQIVSRDKIHRKFACSH